MPGCTDGQILVRPSQLRVILPFSSGIDEIRRQSKEPTAPYALLRRYGAQVSGLQLFTHVAGPFRRSRTKLQSAARL